MQCIIFIVCDAWIYENDAKEPYPCNPYITWISVNFHAASKPCKRAKNRGRTAVKGR